MELEVCENLPVEMDPSSSHCLSLGVGDFKGNKGKQLTYSVRTNILNEKKLIILFCGICRRAVLLG